MTSVTEREVLAFAFALATRSPGSPPPTPNGPLSETAATLLNVWHELPGIVITVGFEHSVRVWRRTLWPPEADELTAQRYRQLLQMARAIDTTTVSQLVTAMGWAA